MIDVILTVEEKKMVNDEAERQYKQAILGGNKNRHGLPADQGAAKDVAIAALGLAGEYAFCKHFGYPFNPWLEKDADVGKAIEIRTTHYPRGKLIWRPSTDKLHHAYVLIRNPDFGDRFEICGWTTGLGAKMVGIFEDPCRFLQRKPREKVYWVRESQLCKDWEVLHGFYYAASEEAKGPPC